MSETQTERVRLAQNEDGEWLCPECGEAFKFAIQVGNHRKRVHGVDGAWSKERKPKEQARKARKQRPAVVDFDAEPPDPGPSRTRARTRSTTRAAEMGKLRRDLKQATSALTLLPFMAKGTADRLTNPAVVKVIDDKAQAFADSWAAVAESNDVVRVNLTRLLNGGIWLNAAAQTAALGYVVAVFSGVAPLAPGAVMLIPEMGQFVYSETPPPAAAAPQNGGDHVGTTE